MSSDVAGQAVADGEEVGSRMALKVDIKDVGSCRKHISVTVSESDIRTIREEALGDLSEKAQVPGFRVGKVPVALLEKRFKKEIASDIKQKVLMASLEQLSDDSKIEPISEPRIDVESLDIPESGDFHYEFEVEVRPEFDLPEYNGITIKRSPSEPTDEDVAEYKHDFFNSYAERVTVDQAAAAGDYVICDLTFIHDGKTIRESRDQALRVMAQLGFQDAVLEGFDKLIVGANAGDTRNADIQISLNSPIIEMRGETVAATFAVTEVQQSQTPVVDKEFCERLGASSEEELETMLRSAVARQFEYAQRQETRSQVLEQIMASADWDLPESLVRQQTENALRREMLEMSQAGFTREQIMARENKIRQDALQTTTQALKEHFVLDKIATVEDIECLESDVDREMLMMSFQTGESVRKIRARLVKGGMMENLTAQMRERKAVDFILEKATFVDVPRKKTKKENQSSVRFAICGNMSSSLIDDAAVASTEDETV